MSGAEVLTGCEMGGLLERAWCARWNGGMIGVHDSVCGAKELIYVVCHSLRYSRDCWIVTESDWTKRHAMLWLCLEESHSLYFLLQVPLTHRVTDTLRHLHPHRRSRAVTSSSAPLPSSSPLLHPTPSTPPPFSKTLPSSPQSSPPHPHPDNNPNAPGRSDPHADRYCPSHDSPH